MIKPFKSSIKIVLNQKISNPVLLWNIKKKELSSLSEKIPQNLKAKIEKICQQELSGESFKVFHLFENNFQNIIVIGFDPQMPLRKIHSLLRLPIKIALKENIKTLDFNFDDFYFFPEINFFDYLKYWIVNILMADYDFAHYYKQEPPKGWPHVETVNFIFQDSNSSQVKKIIEEGKILGEIVNTVRTLANIPGGEMTPEYFVDFIRTIKIPKLKITIFNKNQLRKLKMNCILAVGKGSVHESYLAILKYQGNNKEKPIALVGKGITFDSGGLHLKPSEGMKDMNLDMSGGAGVLGAIWAAAKLNLPRNIMAFIPIVENMPGNDAYRPGDLIKSLSGKVVEIGSPDAEGRVAMADAIEYSKRFDPQIIITLATLTGAAMIAFGDKTAPILSNFDEQTIDKIREISYLTGDFVWPMPLWEEYLSDIKSQFGDLSNIGKSRYGGIIHGAMFLYEFAKPYKFIHIDMAPRMVANQEENLNPGSVGFGVKLIYELLKQKVI